MRTFILAFLLATLANTMEFPQYSEISFKRVDKIKSKELPPIAVLKAELDLNAILSQDPENFYLVETSSTSHVLRMVDPDHGKLFKGMKLDDDKIKEKVFYGEKDRFLENFNDFDLTKLLENRKNIKRIISLGYWYLIIYDYEAELRDRENKLLSSFRLPKLNSAVPDITIFSNGNFALLFNVSDFDKHLYFGKRQLSDENQKRLDLINEMVLLDDFSNINDEIFPWEVFQFLNPPPMKFKFTRDNKPVTPAGIGKFKGKNIYLIKDAAIDWNKEIWSMILKDRLFEQSPNYRPHDEFVSKDLYEALFSAILSLNIKAIDNLVKEGIDLREAKNESGWTPYKYALFIGQKILAEALRDNLCWYLFNKDMLEDLLANEKKLVEVDKRFLNKAKTLSKKKRQKPFVYGLDPKLHPDLEEIKSNETPKTTNRAQTPEKQHLREPRNLIKRNTQNEIFRKERKKLIKGAKKNASSSGSSTQDSIISLSFESNTSSDIEIATPEIKIKGKKKERKRDKTPPGRTALLMLREDNEKKKEKD